jgi:hypothetical protein
LYPDEEVGRVSQEPDNKPGEPEKGEGHYSEGLDHREEIPEDERIGRFSEGEEQLPDDAEKHEHGRFSEGLDETPPETRR